MMRHGDGFGILMPREEKGSTFREFAIWGRGAQGKRVASVFLASRWFTSLLQTARSAGRLS